MLNNGRFLISITQVGIGIHNNFIPTAQIALRCCLQRAAWLSVYFLSVIAVHIMLVILYSQRSKRNEALLLKYRSSSSP